MCLRSNRRAPTKKRPPKSRTVARKRAWSAVSKYIRYTAVEADGLVTCITCRRRYPVKKIQAGHWIPGRTNSILFEEDAIHPQCYGCNVGKAGNPIEYWLWMEQHVGRERMDTLIDRWRKQQEYTLEDYIAYETRYTRCYTEALAALQAQGIPV